MLLYLTRMFSSQYTNTQLQMIKQGIVIGLHSTDILQGLSPYLAVSFHIDFTLPTYWVCIMAGI